MGRVPASDQDTAFPTSHVEVGGGGVAHTSAVGGHTLVFALVGLLTALNLQGACGEKGENAASQGRPRGGPEWLSQRRSWPISRSGWAGEAGERVKLA